MNRFPIEGPGRLAWRLGGRAGGAAALARLRSHPRTSLLLLGLAALAAALVLGAAAGRSSSGNCFAGALSKDPIHCQVLTSAHDEGVLDVEAMYEGASVLYIFVNNPVSEWGAIEDYIFKKAKQAVAQNPVPYCYEDGSDWCNGGTLELLFATGGPQHGTLLPGSEQYANLRMIPGGEEALTEQPGWASFKLLWPRRDAPFDSIQGAARDDSSSSGSRFNLSDVDLMVDGEPDCDARVAGGGYHPGCRWANRHPALGIAGDWGNATSPSGTRFYEVKAEPGREHERIEAVKAAFHRHRPDLEPGVNWPKEVFIPVKYSYLELWRWAVLLDRFAQSRSNDIGIKRATVGHNTKVAFRDSHFLPAAGLALVENTDVLENLAKVRTTIQIWSFDPQKTIKALPQLLSPLGIPEDAVGVVVDGNEIPRGPAVPH